MLTKYIKQSDEQILYHFITYKHMLVILLVSMNHQLDKIVRFFQPIHTHHYSDMLHDIQMYNIRQHAIHVRNLVVDHMIELKFINTQQQKFGKTKSFIN